MEESLYYLFSLTKSQKKELLAILTDYHKIHTDDATSWLVAEIQQGLACRVYDTFAQNALVLSRMYDSIPIADREG